MKRSPGIDFDIDTTTGIVTPARQVASPNCDERPDPCDISLVLVHGISLPPGEFGTGAVEALFTNTLDFDAHAYYAEIRGLEVSAHLFIDRDGELTQFVPFGKRAWHAGASRFRGRERLNDCAIGIELEGTDESPYADAQYSTLTAVIAAIMAAYPTIDARTIAAHSDVSPGRKTDPGPAFDWRRLYDGLPNAADA